ncbi:DUF4333 domain-containing protein [Amycolatopsis sp. FDAARGOS 1241]|uniref:DUF4333 domain-containing protein n=1 Tax=Amycolatopsis sp. FDAARGOS 1241 TaxID=2778070 RepID=UPI00195276FD|nr:DUF4333 domain-containing protein [Amycolatopsis sp. FDAARGOS 1241]QRP49980.1 DUF4333 domain-containing protein [Amycolatopsis sp. FDAARGOS 1241]
MRAVAVLSLCGLGLLLTTSCSTSPEPEPPVKTVTVTAPAGASPGSTGSSAPSATGPGRVFDAKAMDAAVAKILTGTYQLRDVGEVSCPDRQAVTDGSTFHCVVEIAGEPKSVPITVTGTDGDYRVDPPR